MTRAAARWLSYRMRKFWRTLRSPRTAPWSGASGAADAGGRGPGRRDQRARPTRRRADAQHRHGLRPGQAARDRGGVPAGMSFCLLVRLQKYYRRENAKVKAPIPSGIRWRMTVHAMLMPANATLYCGQEHVSRRNLVVLTEGIARGQYARREDAHAKRRYANIRTKGRGRQLMLGSCIGGSCRPVLVKQIRSYSSSRRPPRRWYIGFGKCFGWKLWANTRNGDAVFESKDVWGICGEPHSCSGYSRQVTKCSSANRRRIAASYGPAQGGRQRRCLNRSWHVSGLRPHLAKDRTIHGTTRTHQATLSIF